VRRRWRRCRRRGSRASGRVGRRGGARRRGSRASGRIGRRGGRATRCIGRRVGRATAARWAGHGGRVQPDVVHGCVHRAAIGCADANLGDGVADRLAGAAGERAAKRGVAGRQIGLHYAAATADGLADADAIQRVRAQRRAATNRGRAGDILERQGAAAVEIQTANGGAGAVTDLTNRASGRPL